MKYNFDSIITFKKDEPFDVNYINNVCRQYPQKRFLIEVQNTKGLKSSELRKLNPNVSIRIAGSFDEERCKNGHFTGNDYYNSVIYTRNESIKILEEIEKIEAGINSNWSDIQKLIYVYDKLKRSIMYDPKYEKKLSSEIRSLRGLITKQTVCAGYAIILKEFMDRHNISCEYAEGYSNSNNTGGHSWNIVNINGKKYPIDLTWDNTKFRSGKSESFDWFTCDAKSFAKCHYPSKMEKTQDYEHTLSELDSKIIKKIYLQLGINRSRDFRTTTYQGTRKDGSKFIVAQIGHATINNVDYYRYYYADIDENGKRKKPLILYSESNISLLVDKKRFGKPYPKEYEDAIDSILFSRENIADSLAKKTYYIGKVSKETKGNKTQFVKSVSEIEKPDDKKQKFTFPTRIITRSDGSVFIAQLMTEEPFKANGIDIYRYDILEIVKENGQEILKKNTVFTERNFFLDPRQSLADDFLSRSRLDRKFGEAGGYIGYYDANGVRTYNPDLVSYFETSKKIDIDPLKEMLPDPVPLPSFNELKSLAEKYEIYIDSNDVFESDTSKFKIRNIDTKKIENDPTIISKAMFANIWLTSAGIKWMYDEKRNGMQYAFNEPAEELYNIICSELTKSVKNNGVIDTVGLFRDIEQHDMYKYNHQIIANLFRTPYQAKLINELFLKSIGKAENGITPEPLYTISYASDLAFNNSK